MKVLVVDDEILGRKKLQRIIQEMCDCVAVEDGETALDTAWSGESFDLILLDVMLPGISGHEVCQRLKKDSRTAQVPIIFITGKTEHEDEARAFELGAVDYITKPFRRNIVKARVKTQLELQQYRTRLEEMIKARTIELLQAKSAAENANRIKGEFLTNLNHEIRTPLNGIIGITTLLGKSELDNQQRHYVDLLHLSGKRLMGMVEDLLDLSVIEQNRITLKKTECDLEATLSRVIDEQSSKANDKGLGLHYRIPNGFPSKLITDQRRIRQILIYLIDNAIKFTSTGVVEVTAEVASRLSAEQLIIQFTVNDSGEGIRQDKKQMIFDVFSQGDGTIQRRHEGLGLGLAISRRLVHRLGGTIWLDDKAEPGARFCFTVRCDVTAAATQGGSWDSSRNAVAADH